MISASQKWASQNTYKFLQFIFTQSYLQTSQGSKIFRTKTKKVFKSFSPKTTHETKYITFISSRRKNFCSKLYQLNTLLYLKTNNKSSHLRNFDSRQCSCFWSWTFHVCFYWGWKLNESWSSRHAWWDQMIFEREMRLLVITVVCQYFIKLRGLFFITTFVQNHTTFEHTRHMQFEHEHNNPISS